MKEFLTIFLLSGVFVLTGCSKKPESTHPVVDTIREAVYAAGNLEAENQYQVVSPVSAILLRTVVSEGDTVQEGDTLFILDNKTSQLNEENARLTLELSRANSQSGSDKLRELELQVQSAKEKYNLDSTLFDRQKRLWNEKIGSQNELDQRSLSLTASRAAWLIANSHLNDVRRQLKADWSKAENLLEISRKQNNDFIVRSATSGVVFRINPKQGELVTPQSILAVIGQPSQYIIRLEVDEYDVVRIKPGQKTEISMDSYRGQVFDAVIDRIQPIMNERTRTFEVVARFVDPPASLYPFLTAEANIVVQSRPSALVIPRSYLIDDTYVVLENDEHHEVKTGLKDYKRVEILEGLDSTDVIFKPAP